MKTQYYLMMDEPKNDLYYLKANCNGALYTLTPETLRKRQKGFMSIKSVLIAKQDFHVGILKISDKGMERI